MPSCHAGWRGHSDDDLLPMPGKTQGQVEAGMEVGTWNIGPFSARRRLNPIQREGENCWLVINSV
jgi:hypothetical protein